MNRYLYIAAAVPIGFLLALDAFGQPNFEVNVAILAVVGVSLVLLSLGRSVGVPGWSTPATKTAGPSLVGVEAMTTLVKDAAAGGYGSRIKVAKVLSVSSVVNVGGISDISSIPTKARELEDALVETQPWAKLVFRPPSTDRTLDSRPNPGDSEYLSALEDALAYVSRSGRP